MKPRLWTKDFVVISATTLFLCIVMFLLLSVSAVYAMDQYGVSASMAGFAAGIFTIGTLPFRIVTGKYMEFIGRKKLLTIVLIAFVFPSLLYLLADHLAFFLILRFFHGAMYGAAHTILTTLVMDIIPERRRGEGIGIFTLTFTLGTAMGPFLGVFILRYMDPVYIFIICAVFSAVCLLISFFVHIPEANLTRAQLTAMKSFKLKELFERKAVPISIVEAFISFCYAGALSFLVPFAINAGLAAAASLFFVVSSFFSVIARPLTGRMFDANKENMVMYPSILMMAAGFLILCQATNGFMLLSAAALIGIGNGNVTTCGLAIAIKNCPKHRIGLANSTFFVFMNGSLGLGPFVQGYIVTGAGYNGLFAVLAGVSAVGVFLYYWLHVRQQGKKVDYVQDTYQKGGLP